jgi:hypothetical protein
MSARVELEIGSLIEDADFLDELSSRGIEFKILGTKENGLSNVEFTGPIGSLREMIHDYWQDADELVMIEEFARIEILCEFANRIRIEMVIDNLYPDSDIICESAEESYCVDQFSDPDSNYELIQLEFHNEIEYLDWLNHYMPHLDQYKIQPRGDFETDPDNSPEHRDPA